MLISIIYLIWTKGGRRDLVQACSSSPRPLSTSPPPSSLLTAVTQAWHIQGVRHIICYCHNDNITWYRVPVASPVSSTLSSSVVTILTLAARSSRVSLASALIYLLPNCESINPIAAPVKHSVEYLVLGMGDGRWVPGQLQGGGCPGNVTMFTQAAADNKLYLQHLLSTVRRCGGEVAPSTAPVQAAADTLMVSTEEGREVPCNSSVG